MGLSAALSTAGSTFTESMVLPIIAGAIISVIMADFKKGLDVHWFEKWFDSNPVTWFVDVAISYGIAFLLACVVFLIILVLFFSLGELIRWLS